jgi:hypothetical protein
MALPDSDVVSLNTLPAQVQQVSVSDAAVHVFNNFVEQIARVDPAATAATMKEKPPIPTTQVRRSARFMKPVEALLSLPSTSEQPTWVKPISQKPASQKVVGISKPPQTLQVA